MKLNKHNFGETAIMLSEKFREGKIIGRYSGEQKGPLMIVFGGIHGNEIAGVKALQLFFELLEAEPFSNPDFIFRGRIIGILGNLPAFNANERFIDSDLNRIWSSENVERVRQLAVDYLNSEERELKHNMDIVETEIAEYDPDLLVILDLHTTSSHGGIFTLVPDDARSINLALEMHAPVIKGMTKSVYGTILHYFNTENTGVKTMTVSFEAGQHDDELSVNRAVAAITNCLRTIGCVDAEHVENKHDYLLIEYSRDLPKVSELISRYEIENHDDFDMFPDYKNFQLIEKGELLARDKHRMIQATERSRILMPLYQKKGNDGFFLIREVDE